MTASVDALTPVREHPAFALAHPLSLYMGMPRNLLDWIRFLSLAGGRMNLPVMLEEVSEIIEVDALVARRLAGLGRYKFVSKASELEAVSKSRRPLDLVILMARGHWVMDAPLLMAAWAADGASPAPSIWRLGGKLQPNSGSIGLRLMTSRIPRDLANFSSGFCKSDQPQDPWGLSLLLDGLRGVQHYPCGFGAQIAAALPPAEATVAKRLLLIHAGLRVALDFAEPPEVTAVDYRAVRALLSALPLVPIDRQLSGVIATWGEAVFAAVHDPSYQHTLPDHQGKNWFTRYQAANWTGVAYNTAKKRLAELEQEGVIESTVGDSDRVRGREIFYRFRPEVSRSISWTNPYGGMPMIET